MTDTTRSRSSTSTIGSTGTRRFEDYRDTYRKDWESRYGQDRPWQQHERGYRYGWEAGQDDRYRGKEFQHVESDLQSGWDDYSSRYDRDLGEGTARQTGPSGKDRPGEHQTHSVDAHDTMGGKINHTWENFKDSIREGFDRARMDR